LKPASTPIGACQLSWINLAGFALLILTEVMSALCFFLFLRRVARHFGEETLEKRLLRCFLVSSSVAALAVFWLGAMTIVDSDGAPAVKWLSEAIVKGELLVSALLFFWVFRLLGNLRYVLIAKYEWRPIRKTALHA
jgi:hypothetical protein